MMKALIAMSMIALAGATLAPTASAYGACFGACAEATVPVTINDIDNSIHTCAGNFVVQVGLSNNAEFCNEDNDNELDLV